MRCLVLCTSENGRSNWPLSWLPLANVDFPHHFLNTLMCLGQIDLQYAWPRRCMVHLNLVEATQQQQQQQRCNVQLLYIHFRIFFELLVDDLGEVGLEIN